jgi:hypothetical protein
MLAVLALGSALVARPALGQLGSSVSLTHTVSVTVPPRVKVQIGNVVPSSQIGASVPSDGLAVSVSATQSWTLSIGSVNGDSKLQWSTEQNGGFSSVSGRGATIASGNISPVPAAATVFFRSAGRSESGADAVILTVVAP